MKTKLTALSKTVDTEFSNNIVTRKNGKKYVYINGGLKVLDIKENEQLTRNLEAETAAFISKLQTLEKVNIQSDIFIDPMFTSLRSYATPVPKVEVGRPNPFKSTILD